MATLLLTRPAGRNAALAEAAHTLGFQIVVAPLLTIEPLPFTIPPASYDALLLTSAAAVPAARQAPPLPVHAVGPATAKAAKAAGLRVVATGSSDGHAVVCRAFADGVRHFLHLRGEHGAELSPPAGLGITAVPVYRAHPAEALPAAACAALQQPNIIVLLFSPRTARCFSQLVGKAALPLQRISIVAISAKAAQAAGKGWKFVRIAAAPTTAAMLEAVQQLRRETDGARPMDGARPNG